MMKVDMRKAYDTIEWSFLKEMLECLGFPARFTSYVMKYVGSPKFPLMINGVMHGYFPSQRGLRQGDPLSPLLFVICMEYLSRILKKVSEREDFKFHPKCKALKLTHLCFADDILLCCKGEFSSIHLILRGFKLFSEISGLQANVNKLAMYCSGMKDEDIQRALD